MRPKAVKGLRYQFRAACKRIKKLRKLKRGNQYDACISFSDSANICNVLVDRKLCKIKALQGVRDAVPVGRLLQCIM